MKTELLFDEANQYLQGGSYEEAEILYEKILEISPKHYQSLCNLGLIAKQHKKYEMANSLFRKAIQINPNYAEGFHNLANSLKEQGDNQKALACYQKAIQINPRNYQSYNSLGVLLKEQGSYQKALTCYQKAIQINRNNDQSHYNIGILLQEIGEFETAIQYYQKAIQINPNHFYSYNNIGLLLKEQGKIEEAIQYFHETIISNPSYASEAYYNIGCIKKEENKMEEAIQYFRHALNVDSSHINAHTNLIYCQHYMPEIDLVDEQIERRKWNRNFILPLYSQHQPHTNRVDLRRKLRIGYVSADFKRHSAAIGFSDLILNCDDTQFELFCYSGVEKSKEDHMTALFKSRSCVWRSVHGLNDARLVKQIRNDQIDILVDLSGHTSGNRLLTFGCKPAPIQVTGIGSSAPGLTTMDYRLTSRFQTFSQEEALFPEQPIYLDHTLGFSPFQIELSVTSLPAYKNKFLTFGSFNRWDKISIEVLSLWAELLLAIPNSRLVFKSVQLSDKSLRSSVSNRMEKYGIGKERIDLIGKTSVEEHMGTYQKIDISLDPFPYGGGITTLESLWMGVPVISLYNEKKFVSRNATVFLLPLDLRNWLVTNKLEYIELAKFWSTKFEELGNLRLNLRNRVESQSRRFTQQVESAYRKVWHRWCQGKKPSPLRIEELVKSEK